MVDTNTIRRRFLAGATPAVLAGALGFTALTSGSPRHTDRAAQSEVQQGLKLIASDSLGGEAFGSSVDVSGNLAVVGARWDDVGGVNSIYNSGSAFVYDMTTGEELFRLNALDLAMNDEFGSSVAVDGDRAVIGAYKDDDGGDDTGSAYVFDLTTGAQLFKLTASDADIEDYFGSAVAVSGDLAVIGAYRNDDEGRNSGSAYVFDITTGQEIYKLTADDAAADDQFGIAVDISGNRALVGARYDNDFNDKSGSAYVFDLTTGDQIRKLNTVDPGPRDLFGTSVAIDGDRAVIGSPGNRSDGQSITGAVYVFDITTGMQLSKLIASDADGSSHSYGSSVALSGNIALVGSGYDDDEGSNAGAVYIFDISTGSEIAKVTASDAETNDYFGSTITTNGEQALIGAWGDDDGGSAGGAAYIFELFVCVADLNGDGVVDAPDLGILLGNFNETNASAGDGDINGDGAVDAADLGLLIDDFGQACQ